MKKTKKLKETKASKVRQFKYFLNLVNKLSPEEYVGLLRMFNIKFIEEDKDEPRPFELVYEELLDKFIAADSIKRFNTIWILEAATTPDGEDEFHETIKYGGVK